MVLENIVEGRYYGLVSVWRQMGKSGQGEVQCFPLEKTQVLIFSLEIPNGNLRL